MNCLFTGAVDYMVQIGLSKWICQIAHRNVIVLMIATIELISDH